MNNGSDFAGILKDVGSFLAELLASALWGLYMIISSLFTMLADFFKSINIPMLPSRSKLLQDNLISGGLLLIFVVYILVMNISAFNLFRIDKKKAKAAPPKEAAGRRKRPYDRISEKKLLSRCFFGGALGGFIGMKVFRHKTLKPKFTVGVTVMLVIQMMIFSFIVGFFGFWLYFT